MQSLRLLPLVRTLTRVLLTGRIPSTVLARLEAACARAGSDAARSYRHVDSILKHGLDQTPLPAAAPRLALPTTHEHVRGPQYYL